MEHHLDLMKEVLDQLETIIEKMTSVNLAGAIAIKELHAKTEEMDSDRYIADKYVLEGYQIALAGLISGAFDIHAECRAMRDILWEINVKQESF